MAAHAKLSASGAHRWMACPGSIALEALFPDAASKYAAEGTAAHTLAERCLREERMAGDYLGQVVDGFEVTTEMADGVQSYLDYVRSSPGQRLFEQRVDFSAFVPGGFGTADAVVMDGDLLTIVDLKYGKGVRILAEDNPQALLYAVGAWQTFGFLFEFERVRLVIVQPRLDHVDEWDVTPDTLRLFAEEARRAADAALAENAPCIPGEKQCRFCKAKAGCRALANWGLESALSGFAVLGPDAPVKDTTFLTIDEIAALLPRLPLISEWATALTARAQAELEAGGTVPGYKLVEGRSLRAWRSPEEAETALSVRIPPEQLFERKLISPAGAEKILGKKDPLLPTLTTRPAGKPTLAPVSDKRPAIEIDPMAGFAAVA